VAEWYLGVDGQRRGPWAIADLRQNGLTAHSHVWKAGMAQWQLASEVPEIAALLA
jgi:GYF domain 2